MAVDVEPVAVALPAPPVPQRAVGSWHARFRLTWRWFLRAATPSSTGENIDALDGLRGCAIVGVFLFHLLLFSSGPIPYLRPSTGAWSVLGTGVELFFVLSGFLLFLPYARAALANQQMPSARQFFERRAFRILPAYWASLAIFLLFFVGVTATRQGVTDVGLHVVFLHNLLKSTIYSINPGYWTLAVEVQFYLVLPVIAVPVVASLRRGRPYITALVFVLIALVSMASYGFSAAVDGGFDRFALAPRMLHYLPVFAVGIVVSLLFVSATEGPWANQDLTALAKAVGVGGLALLGLMVCLNQSALYDFRYGYVLVQLAAGLAYGAILLGALLGWRTWRAILAHPLLRFVAMISYSLYTWHFLVLQRYVLPTLGDGIVSSIRGLFVGSALLVVVSFASYVAFERPFIGARRARHGGSQDSRTAPSPGSISGAVNGARIRLFDGARGGRPKTRSQ